MSLPNYNPANADSLAGVLKEVLKNYGLSFECSMPAVVKSYDRTRNVALVQPAIRIKKTTGETVDREAIELPVHCPSGGDIVLSFPLKQGDTGWIIAGDRDIALFKQSLTISNPNTNRQHRLAFGFFLPDKVNGINISQDNANDFVIQTLDGATKIVLGTSKVDVVTNGTLTGTCNSATITASQVDIVGNVSITGTLAVSGAATAAEFTAGGIPYSSHVHTSSGSGYDTGTPKNAG